jgi:hypothetical protein
LKEISDKVPEKNKENAETMFFATFLAKQHELKNSTTFQSHWMY